MKNLGIVKTNKLDFQQQLESKQPKEIQINLSDDYDPDNIPCLLPMRLEEKGKNFNFLYDTGASANLVKLSCVPKSKRKQIVNRSVTITGIAPNEVV